MRSYLIIALLLSLSSSSAQMMDKSKLSTYSPTSLHSVNLDSTFISGVQNTGIESGLNHKTIFCHPEDFSFIVSGHFHGASNSTSGMPASSLMANLNFLNHKNASFLICLGDLFLNVERDNANYEKYLFSQLDLPLFNAVGNHDVDNDYYTSHYGPTYFSFDIGKTRFLILDTELKNGDIVGEQFHLLKSKLGDLKGIKNVFIFMHRTLWVDMDEKLAELFTDNTQSATTTNFKNEVFPVISSASKKTKIYLMSGSMGNAPASFFYHPFNKNITFIATAIRDLPRDAVLLVHSVKDEISFETFSLNSNKVLSLQKYTYDWWKDHRPEEPPFNWRLVPLYLWQMITHRYFWYGIGYVASLGLIIYGIIRFKRKRRAKKT